MSILLRSVVAAWLIWVMAASNARPAEAATSLTPGSTITLQFPEMPPTFHAVFQKTNAPAQVSIFLQHYDLLKGKPFLMVSSNAKSRPRAQQICDAAKAAGAKAVLVFEDAGKHDFPVTAYPAVRQWLRGPAME
jgi:hypothetical protein